MQTRDAIPESLVHSQIESTFLWLIELRIPGILSAHLQKYWRIAGAPDAYSNSASQVAFVVFLKVSHGGSSHMTRPGLELFSDPFVSGTAKARGVPRMTLRLGSASGGAAGLLPRRTLDGTAPFEL